MGKITEFLKTARQHYYAKRLRSAAIRDYANDPDVEFHNSLPEPHDAPHGVNTPEEMRA